MTAADLVAALQLPDRCLVDRRVPKKLLLESGAHSPSDKRRVTEGIEALHWHAALKPTTIGVPEYRDAEREYLEVAVVLLSLRRAAKADRLVELVHRAVPYPVLLVSDSAGSVGVSAANVRWAQNEAGKTVLEDGVTYVACSHSHVAVHRAAFLAALALGKQPRLSLLALYNGWVQALLALQAARITGEFRVAGDKKHAAARAEGLREHVRLASEVARLRAAAAKEKQVPRQVELNLQVKKLEAALVAARAKL